MANTLKQEEERNEEERLQDTFISSFMIGAIILVIWLAVFLVYVSRL